MERSEEYWTGFWDGKRDRTEDRGGPISCLGLIVALIAVFGLGFWFGC